jgi:hypothetical protein
MQQRPRIDLRKQALEALPSKGLNLLETIESFAKREVRFTSHDAVPEHLKYPGYKPSTPCVGLDHIAATVVLPSKIEPQAVVHELLHIHRNWVEGVPQWQPVPDKICPESRAYIGGNENLLEHLTIVPREADYGFDRAAWNGFARKGWEDYPWPDVQGERGRRIRCLKRQLGTDLADDPAIHQLGREYLRLEGMEDEADKFSARTQELLHSKPRLVACTVRFFKILRHATRLVYYDVRKGEERFEPVPER